MFSYFTSTRISEELSLYFRLQEEFKKVKQLAKHHTDTRNRMIIEDFLMLPNSIVHFVYLLHITSPENHTCIVAFEKTLVH